MSNDSSMANNLQQEVKSPCIGICAINDMNGLCQGCYRTIDEIKGWWDMSQADQQNLLSTIAERELELANFDD